MSHKLSPFLIASITLVLTTWSAVPGIAQSSNQIISTNPSADIIKCLTPNLIVAQQSQGFESEQVLQSFKEFNDTEIENIENYMSPSGRFLLIYSRSGADQVPSEDINQNLIPDYIEKAAEYADESYDYLVNELGYTNPLIPGSPYEIRFRQINSYGFTQSAGETSFIVVHRNFDNFPENNDPDGIVLGALKVTIAHELKHAIQYAETRWQGDSGRGDWLEMDATMIEEIVYPQVDDYIYYLGVCSSNACSVILDPNRSTPGSYYHVSWMLYFNLEIGSDFWVDVWYEIGENPNESIMFDAIRSQLIQRGLDFNYEFTKNHLWHTATGINSIPNYGFPDASLFPDAAFKNFNFLPENIQNLPEESTGRAAQYLMINEASSYYGEILISINSRLVSAGLVVIAYNENGTFTEIIQTTSRVNESNLLRLFTGIQAQDIEKMSVVVANPSNFSQDFTITFSARELPEIVTIYPIYPNPFNPLTTIPFSIPSPMHVRLDVYDLQGRNVRSLLNSTLNKGFYDVVFDGNELASGIYIYMLQTGSTSQSGKMVLLK